MNRCWDGGKFGCRKNEKSGERRKDWSNTQRGWKSFWTTLKRNRLLHSITKLLHSISKPRPQRGGVKVIEDVFDDTQLLTRVEVKWQEWKDPWQVDTSEQLKDDKPWENDALQELVEVLPPMTAED